MKEIKKYNADNTHEYLTVNMQLIRRKVRESSAPQDVKNEAYGIINVMTTCFLSFRQEYYDEERSWLTIDPDLDIDTILDNLLDYVCEAEINGYSGGDEADNRHVAAADTFFGLSRMLNDLFPGKDETATSFVRLAEEEETDVLDNAD